MLAGELLSALRTGHWAPEALPVGCDTALAEVVHASQHHRLGEQVIADGTGEVLLQGGLTHVAARRHLERLELLTFTSTFTTPLVMRLEEEGITQCQHIWNSHFLGLQQIINGIFC